jgi:N-acetyldiaminopimelate deacetylase
MPCHRSLATGLIVEYTVNEGDYLLFRADIDALPIEEKTGASFSSKNACMHACGHDIHSSTLYGFVRHVVENRIDQNMIFVFQPGEEGGGGAEQVLRSGILEQFRIKNAFALHVTDEYPAGTIASTNGVLFAAAVELDVLFHGKASHVAFPERGINAMKAMRVFLDKVDAIVADYGDPIMFGCGKITSGVIRNIIPAEAKCECTLRTLSVHKLKAITDRFQEELDAIKAEVGITYELHLNSPYTEVVVDSGLFEVAKTALSKKFIFVDCGYKMTAEDFGLFSHEYPAFMFWLGTSLGERYGLHTPNFLPDDSMIAKGIEAFTLLLDAVK